MITKRCTKCHKLKSRDGFSKDKQAKDGLRNKCKVCVAKDDRARYMAKHLNARKYFSCADSYRVINNVKQKRCVVCKKWKSLSVFRKNKQAKDGLQSQCKECCAEYNKNHRKTLKSYLVHRLATLRDRCSNPNNRAYERYGAKGVRCLFRDIDEFYYHIVTDLGFDSVEKLKGLEIHRTGKHYKVNGIKLLTQKEHVAKHVAIRKQDKECVLHLLNDADRHIIGCPL